MEMERVVSILDSLAAGVDPGSGGVIPHETYQSPDVIRALFTAANTLRQPRAAAPARASGDRPHAAGRRWSEEEDSLLCHEFDGGMSVPDIARQHDRTRGAITSRLVKLGRLDPETVRVRER